MAQDIIQPNLISYFSSGVTIGVTATGLPNSDRSPHLAIGECGRDRRLRPQKRERSVGRRLGSSSAGGKLQRPLSYSHVGVDRGDGRHHGGSRGTQSPHGDGEISDPLACFKGVIDEGIRERAGQSTPNTTPKPRIWFSKVTRCPTSFLRAMIKERSA
jgi:hypothetical protein